MASRSWSRGKSSLECPRHRDGFRDALRGTGIKEADVVLSGQILMCFATTRSCRCGAGGRCRQSAVWQKCGRLPCPWEFPVDLLVMPGHPDGVWAVAWQGQTFLGLVGAVRRGASIAVAIGAGLVTSPEAVIAAAWTSWFGTGSQRGFAGRQDFRDGAYHAGETMPGAKARRCVVRRDPTGRRSGCRPGACRRCVGLGPRRLRRSSR